MNIKIRKIIVCTLIMGSFLASSFFSLSAQENTLIVNADEAEYDGHQMLLSGNVHLEHDLGEIQAKKMILTQNENEKCLRPANLIMEGPVLLLLHNGTSLTCGEARLNYLTLQGDFKGNMDQDHVTYRFICHDKEKHSIPIVIKSHDVHVEMGQEDKKQGVFSIHSIDQMVARGDVSVSYNFFYSAEADIATYYRLKNDSMSMPGLKGNLILRSSSPSGVCRLMSTFGDVIHAQEMRIDTFERILTFEKPVGEILIARGKREMEKVDFSANVLKWEEQNNLLTLQDHVTLTFEEMGQVTTDTKVDVFQQINDGKREVSMIRGDGPALVVYVDPTKGLSHTLECYGPLSIDHQQRIMILQSPKQDDGKISQQVHFKDIMGEMYADHLTLEYGWMNGVVRPAKLTLKGNVHIRNQSSSESGQDHPFLQYALADVVEYTPEDKQLSLAAAKGNRVLFYDKLNNIQVSAPALKIKRDEVTKKESIRGVGDVRFTFAEHELESIKKRFNLNEEKEKVK